VINFFNRALIEVLTRILFVAFFNLFVLHLQVDVIDPLLLNSHHLFLVSHFNFLFVLCGRLSWLPVIVSFRIVLLVLTTDYSD